jgi:hypothetical protein
LGLWPPLSEAVESTYDTAGGPIRFYVVRKVAVLQVVEEDTLSEEVIVDVVISSMEREILLSDFVIGELGIVILNAYKGYWRFDGDPHGRVRYSRRSELW